MKFEPEFVIKPLIFVKIKNPVSNDRSLHSLIYVESIIRKALAEYKDEIYCLTMSCGPMPKDETIEEEKTPNLKIVDENFQDDNS